MASGTISPRVPQPTQARLTSKLDYSEARRRPEDIASSVNNAMTPVRRAGDNAISRARIAAGSLSQPATPEQRFSDSGADEESAAEDEPVGRGVARRSRKSAENIASYEGEGAMVGAWSEDSQSGADEQPGRRPGAGQKLHVMSARQSPQAQNRGGGGLKPVKGASPAFDDGRGGTRGVSSGHRGEKLAGLMYEHAGGEREALARRRAMETMQSQQQRSQSGSDFTATDSEMSDAVGGTGSLLRGVGDFSNFMSQVCKEPNPRPQNRGPWLDRAEERPVL